MNKYLFIFLFLCAGHVAQAQKKPSLIHVTHSKSFEFIKQPNGDELDKIYQATFQQDNTILTSDSAYFHPKQNTCEAFGHVVIIQGDTLHIYGDMLHYDGNTKIAIMTDHVKLVDKDATLTTNYFTYNTGTRIGTYTGGGKLVNNENTLTSKNGYYFSGSRDAYFRYDVVMNTVDAIVKTDTLRYNSGTAISYFYGPTHIYGKKDKDVLYTENGTYDTKTEQALFGKKNLYTQGTKTLKGDSLFYDRITGYAKAIKHVVFNDNEQKATVYGNLAEYTKADERTIVTQGAYVVLVSVDSVKNDSAATKNINKTRDNGKVTPAVVKHQEVARNALKNKAVVNDTLQASLKKDSVKVKRDSIFLSADTIQTQILINKTILTTRELRRLAGLRDTTIIAQPTVIFTKRPKELPVGQARLLLDSTSYLHKNYFPRQPRDTTVRIVKIVAPTKKPPGKNIKIIPKVIRIDSVFLDLTPKVSDTARVRILMAWHNAKIFKSDLQARADSIFYSYGDSTVRMYVKPMVWSNNSQLSGDTINLQMRNKKIDNIEFSPHAFVVNLEKGDSTHFNQVGGKKMRGYFKEGKLDKIFVLGNAETVYYNRDSLKRVYKIERSISSRIGVRFNKGELAAVIFTVKNDLRDIPLSLAKEDDKVLRGFIWKPKDRPISKESIIPALAVTKAITKKTNVKNPVKKTMQKSRSTSYKINPAKKTGSDTVHIKTDTLKRVNIKPDSIKLKSNESISKQ